MTETIRDNNQILALIIYASFKQDGIHFFTSNEFTQQLAYMKRPQGYHIQPHIHRPVPRQVIYTKEVLFIKKGKVRLDLYNEDKKYLESRILQSGDVALLAFGGHGFHMIEESEIIEAKQGPYAGDNDKERFTAISEEKINIHQVKDQ